MRHLHSVIALIITGMALGLLSLGPVFGQAASEDKGAGAAPFPPATSSPPAPPAARSPGTSSPPASPAQAASPPAASGLASPPPPAASAADAASPASKEAQRGDLAGEEVTMPEQTIVYAEESASWNNAFATIVDSLKKVYAFLDAEKVTPSGPPMTIYLSTDDQGFKFRAAAPVAHAPANPPAGLAVGASPAGKAIRYIHQGAYDALDETYEMITNQLDEKGLEAQDVFVETYMTDPRITASDKLLIEVYVPVK